MDEYTKEVASKLAEKILERERKHEMQVALGKALPRSVMKNPTMLTRGFSRTGRIVFKFD